jgi:glutathione S-transferase
MKPMMQNQPTLMTFGFSHFCEKARWALDWHGVDYTEIGCPPGLHLLLAKRCGAKRTTLPILLDGETVIQGSSAIIDWAETKAQDGRPSLAPQADLAEAREIERRADQVIGINARRLAFAEMLPSYPHLVKPALFLRASGWHRLIGHLMWPVAWRVMMQQLEVRPGAAAESRAKLEAELDWLDAKLADGRSYLAGDRFSRADLTVASLLSGYAKPREMPAYHDLAGPDALAADVERWSARPVMRWVIRQYGAHRLILK